MSVNVFPCNCLQNNIALIIFLWFVKFLAFRRICSAPFQKLSPSQFDFESLHVFLNDSVCLIYLILLQPDGPDLFNFINGYRSWANYLTDMEQDGTWGDHVILYAAANCFDTSINVISSQSEQSDLTIEPVYVTSSNPLVLGHVHEVHYVSLIPRQGMT